jgi:hypothetical protein
MFYEQHFKLVLIFHLKLIYGHLVLHFINVQLVCLVLFFKDLVLKFGFILGQLPFQPYAGTRKDRAVMKHILDTKPTGCISGKKNVFLCLLIKSLDSFE